MRLLIAMVPRCPPPAFQSRSYPWMLSVERDAKLAALRRENGRSLTNCPRIGGRSYHHCKLGIIKDGTKHQSMRRQRARLLRRNHALVMNRNCESVGLADDA